ncbi:site-2 protease family protein [Brevibacillus migulae]|uniref:site-2 protease family protein n=1 Tax=Brevibacillus migulae TaxID=1644114 RepID=UPI00106E61DB|nr:site-2 protease family protein [Brevibacillus migulae]
MNKKRSALLAIGAFLLSNLKWIWGLLKFSKFGATFLSMFVTLLLYGQIYGWKFGIAIIYLIFIHEMGHVIAAKRKGIRTSPAIFIPFVGAMIAMKEQPRDAATEAYLAYGGPLAGLLSFLPAFPLYWWTEDPFWILVIYVGAMLNLFNLLPVSPLDGGRIVSVLSTKIWLFGLIGLGVFVYFSPGPMLFLILLFGILTWWTRLREGYRQQVLSYERERLLRFRRELDIWPTLDSSWETRERLYSDYLSATAKRTEKRRFYVPFLHDEQRLASDRQKIDRIYGTITWELYQQWERTPVLFADSDPNQPIPSPILAGAKHDADEKLKSIDEQLQRLTTYYEAPASTKWKVLAAYLGLAAVLSLCFFYANTITQGYISAS